MKKNSLDEDDFFIKCDNMLVTLIKNQKLTAEQFVKNDKALEICASMQAKAIEQGYKNEPLLDYAKRTYYFLCKLRKIF